jgi:hypothetical protein
MKKIILLTILLISCSFAQTFKVEKTTGKVSVQKGTSEKWIDVKQGDKLNGSDVILTGNNSSVQLSRDGSIFMLKNDAALGLNSIKKISINELILALTMEEIKSVPGKNKSGTKSTALYGTEVKAKNNVTVNSNGLGSKKINGARQLAESGFKESSIIVAKETFRKYPETASNAKDRLFFAGLLEELNLNDEAFDEYSGISKLELTSSEKELVKNKISLLSIKLSNRSGAK